MRFLAAALGGLAVVAVFEFAFCNWPRHDAKWTAERLDQSILRGLTHLYNSAAFSKPLAEGGETASHHHLLGLVLDKEEYPLLREQMRRAAALNENAPRWRAFYGLPGWPIERLTRDDREWMKAFVSNIGEPSGYGGWLCHALNPERTQLPASQHQVLFEDTDLLKTSYELTHALLVYIWIERNSPEVARARRMDQRIEQVNRRLRLIQAWSPRCGDSGIERVAFWFLQRQPPEIPRRAIERILNNQNTDGGWTWIPAWTRTLQEMGGWNPRDGQSRQHPTFLALVALTHHRELLAHGSRGSGPAEQGSWLGCR